MTDYDAVRADFPKLLQWHLEKATGISKPGMLEGWSKKAFAQAARVSEKTIGNWLNGEVIPTETSFYQIQIALFGKDKAGKKSEQMRADLREAYNRFRSTAVELLNVATKSEAAPLGTPDAPAPAAIILSEQFKEDIASLALTDQQVVQYVSREVERHPDIFKGPFSSWPFSMGANVIVCSWDLRLIKLERVVPRGKAYPLTKGWIAALSEYRRTTELPYRRSESYRLQQNARAIALQYERMVFALNRYIRDFDVTHGTDYSNELLLSLIDDLAIHQGDESLDLFIRKAELILSNVHKTLLEHAPLAVIHHEPQASKTYSDQPRDDRESTPHQPRILIIEDDGATEDSLHLMARAAAGKAAIIDTDYDGYDAVRRLVDRKYDIVIADLNIEGLAGAEVIRVIKAVDPKTKIIVVSGFVRLGGLDQIEHLVDLAIEKPFISGPVKDAIEKFLAEKSQSG